MRVADAGRAGAVRYWASQYRERRRRVDANREQAETLRQAIRAYSENEPQKHEDPPEGRAGVPANRGISAMWQS
jgi:type II secretory pathway pseudopilin PulG